jgi:ribosomal protein S18 acetylase RimI-like enzyme
MRINLNNVNQMEKNMTIEVSSNEQKLNISDVHEMLSNVFWSPGITENEILKGIKNSALVVGAYVEGGKQVGFLKVVSDKVRFAYINDVVVHEDYRRQGLGQKMVNFALSHAELKDVYQWLLITMDAHGVYRKCGFELLKNHENWMTIIKSRPDRANFAG